MLPENVGFLNEKLHRPLKQRPPQDNGMAGESFRVGNKAGAATRAKVSCFALAVGQLGTASGGRDRLCGSALSPNLHLGWGLRAAAPLIKVVEITPSQKQEVRQGPPV